MTEEKKQLYEEAKRAPKGAKVQCPMCGTMHVKTRAQSIFDKTKCRRAWQYSTVRGACAYCGKESEGGAKYCNENHRALQRAKEIESREETKKVLLDIPVSIVKIAEQQQGSKKKIYEQAVITTLRSKE